MNWSLMLLFIFVFQASGLTVDVQSEYEYKNEYGKKEKIVESGAGVLTEYFDPVTRQIRKFVFTSSHLSQGESVQIKIKDGRTNIQGFQVIGRLADNKYDLEIFELKDLKTQKVHAKWDASLNEFNINAFYNVESIGLGSPRDDVPSIFIAYGNFNEKEESKNNPFSPILALTSSQDFSQFLFTIKSGIRPNQLVRDDGPLREASLLKQIVAPTFVVAGMSGSPVFRRFKSLDAKDALIGLTSQYDLLANRSYYVSQQAILDLFRDYIGENEERTPRRGLKGLCKWEFIDGQTVRVFGSSAEAIHAREQSGRANRGDSASGSRLKMDYSKLGSRLGMTYNGEAIIGFRINNMNVEANLASYYWILENPQAKVEVIRHNAMALSLINIPNTELKFSSNLIIKRNGNELSICTADDCALIKNLAKEEVKDVVYKKVGSKFVDLRALFLLDLSVGPQIPNLKSALKQRKIQLITPVGGNAVPRSIEYGLE